MSLGLGRYIPTKYLLYTSAFLNRTLGLGGRQSFSEFGEDLLLNHVFGGKTDGLYVDVGANHPINQSNTYKFYKQGWTGINVDASPIYFDLLQKFRPRDKNIRALVSDADGEEVDFFDFGVSDMNTADKDRALEVSKRIGKEFSKTKLKVRSLASILEENLPKNSEIDLLTVDAEGNDLKVLKSNRWDLYRPKVILVEYHFGDLGSLLKSELYLYLSNLNYELVNIAGPTLIFISKTVRNYQTWPFMKAGHG